MTDVIPNNNSVAAIDLMVELLPGRHERHQMIFASFMLKGQSVELRPPVPENVPRLMSRYRTVSYFYCATLMDFVVLLTLATLLHARARPCK